MPYAPELKAAFLFGEGVHNWWNRQNNRYMDDVFVYDVQGHRWVCVHPGTDVKNEDLKLDAHGKPQIYAIFIQDNKIIDQRAGIVIDQCHKETYTPLETATPAPVPAPAASTKKPAT
jgi:hypothetical protein